VKKDRECLFLMYSKTGTCEIKHVRFPVWVRKELWRMCTCGCVGLFTHASMNRRPFRRRLGPPSIKVVDLESNPGSFETFIGGMG